MPSEDSVPVSAHLVEGQETSGGRDQSKPLSYNDLYSWLRISPEVMGITSAICDDILGGGEIEFEGSESAVKQATEWASKNHFRKKLYSALQDYALTGDGYLGQTILTTSKVNALASGIAKTCGVEPDINKIRTRSPEIFYPRSLFVLKTTTIKIDYDRHGIIKGYIQCVDGVFPKDNLTTGNCVRFEPEEVIHLSLNNLGHDVYGNSPFWSTLHEISSLWYAKDYGGMFFQNDGTPNLIYKMPDEDPKSANVKKFKKTLKSFMKAKNKQKSLVLTGNVETERLNNFNKDLEFENFINVFTQRILMAWDMPLSRVSNVVGKTTDHKSTVESNEGYYKKINRLQAEVEEVLNNELWWLFGDVRMHFAKSYKRDESREADIAQRLVLAGIFTQNDGRLYVGKKPLEEEGMDEARVRTEKGMGKLPEQKVSEETGNQFQTAAEKMAKRDRLGKRSQLVIPNFADFIKIVEANPAQLPFNQSKVFVQELPDRFVFFYSDLLFNYESTVWISDVEFFAVDERDFRMKYTNMAVPARPKEKKVIIEG